MRVLLATLNSKYIHANLAVRLLYKINKHHKDLSWKEFTIKEDKDSVAAFCSEFEIVAFSCYIWNITHTLEVAKKIKGLNPNIKILLGGPEVSYGWEEVIALPQIDFIITGEGEIPFSEFLKCYPEISNIDNVITKENLKLSNKSKTANFDLQQYRNVLPYDEDELDSLANRVLYIETSRGCPYKCEFCLASLDNSVRYLPMEGIKSNLLFLMQHGRVIKFLDRTFNVKKDFTIEIFKFILEHHRPANIFQFEITADILHPDIVKFIHEHVPAGLFRFEIGIQTVNHLANLEVKRKQNFEKTKGVIKSLENKVEMHLDLIVGLPLDYWADIKYSFEEVFKLFAPELQLGFLKFLKGTPMRDKAQHGFVFDPLPPYQLIESKYLSQTELEKITALEHALEIYWNKKRAINTLKYITANYSIFEFLLELGIYFGTVRDYHRFSLRDVYEIIDQFTEKHYPGDKIIKRLIAADYYLQHKVKPQNLIIHDLERSKKIKLIEENKLNHHKYRFIIMELDFDFAVFQKENVIIEKAGNLIFQYNGSEKASVNFTHNYLQIDKC